MTSRRALRAPRRAALMVCAFVMRFTSSAAFAAAPPEPQTKPPSAEELKAARELFHMAFKDEQEKRFAQALEKFQRVAAIKSSASVRYRIASVLEALGRLREARDGFRALAVGKPKLQPNEKEIAESSLDKAQLLDAKLPHILLSLQRVADEEVVVKVDGAVQTATTSPRSIELDPGEHVVESTSPNPKFKPFNSKVVLVAGADVSVVVPVEVVDPSVAPPDTTVVHADHTIPYVLVGSGGALLVTGIVLLAVRAGDISEIERVCGSDNVCPSSQRQHVTSTRDEAALFGPLGVGLGLVGLAGVGVGSWLLLRPTSPRTSAFRPTISPRWVQGGATIGVTGAF
jgi:hypothetical protein